MRKCQNQLNLLSRNRGLYAGQGTLEQSHNLQSHGSGRKSGTTCQSDSSHVHQSNSCCLQALGQNLRRICKGKSICLLGSGGSWAQSPWVTPVYCIMDWTLSLLTEGSHYMHLYSPLYTRSPGTGLFREQDMVTIGGQGNSEQRVWKAL